MFKTALTAAITVTASLAATIAPAMDKPILPALQGIIPTKELGAYCEWVTLYDVYGNWFTVWQCY